MLPNVLQTSATDHVPVLAGEVRELLAVQPGETVVDATFGAGGHASLLAADLQGRGKLIAIHLLVATDRRAAGGQFGGHERLANQPIDRCDRDPRSELRRGEPVQRRHSLDDAAAIR